eukprot:98003-Amphidinium_carterae.1
MENGVGQSIIQVENEPAIKQLAEEAAREPTIPWRQSSPHTHQAHGSVERFHQTLFAQIRAIRFDLMDGLNLQTPGNVPEALLPWILQHVCFTINSDAGEYNATQQFAVLVKWSWQTSSRSQSTVKTSGTRRRRLRHLA